MSEHRAETNGIKKITPKTSDQFQRITKVCVEKKFDHYDF